MKLGDVVPSETEGERLRGIAVRFPDSVHSIPREQRFYFGLDGLLRVTTIRLMCGRTRPAALYF